MLCFWIIALSSYCPNQFYEFRVIWMGNSWVDLDLDLDDDDNLFL